ncbi:MAG: hypothetical protein IH995_09025 [Proteobacteria bacterium]|nr:hypothetical protein [Pseudomonadota bacterium]
MQAKAGLPVHFSKLILLGLLGLLFLAGCSSVQGYQKALDFKDYLPAKPSCVNKSKPINKECRNKFIDWYIVQSSINFSAFVRNLTKDRNASGLILDNLRTGLEMAIVVVTGAGPKTALGATAGGLGALQGSIDKRLFYEKTVPALVKFMDAKRSLILAEILKGRSQDIDTYPFFMAIRDLQRFNDAGSVTDAISSVAAEGAKQAKEAEEEVTKTIIRLEGIPPSVEVINTLIYLKNFLTDFLTEAQFKLYAGALEIDFANKTREEVTDQISLEFLKITLEKDLNKYLAPFTSEGVLSNLEDKFGLFILQSRYFELFKAHLQDEGEIKEVDVEDFLAPFAACWGVDIEGKEADEVFEGIKTAVSIKDNSDVLNKCQKELENAVNK